MRGIPAIIIAVGISLVAIPHAREQGEHIRDTLLTISNVLEEARR